MATVAELERLLAEAKIREADQKSKCSTCHGKGFICDTTYDRTGVDHQCSQCFGTGFDADKVKAIIDRAFGGFYRWPGFEHQTKDQS